jgi:hypothetical protein
MLTVPGWDSLGHLKILSELDIRFQGRVARIEQIAEARSVKDLKALLRGEGLIAR